MDWPISWQKIKDNASGGNAASPLYIKESKEIRWDGQIDGIQEVNGVYRICEWLSKDQLLGAQISAVSGGQEYSGTIVDYNEWFRHPSNFKYPVFGLQLLGDNGELASLMLGKDASTWFSVLTIVAVDLDIDDDGAIDMPEGTWAGIDDHENEAARLSYLKTNEAVAITDRYQEFFSQFYKPKQIYLFLSNSFLDASEYTQIVDADSNLEKLLEQEGMFELKTQFGQYVTTLDYPTVYRNTSDGSRLFVCGAFILKHERSGMWYIKNRTL